MQSLELDSCIEAFTNNELTSLSNKELKETFLKLDLPLGKRIKIIKKIQEIKVRGT